MKKLICALLLIAMLVPALGSFGANAADWENPYKDVIEGKWYYNAVKYCVQHGIMSGTSATTFEPSTPVSRAMFVTMIAAYSGAALDAYRNASVFGDVPAGKWYSAPVAWAADKGIVSGVGGGNFAPARTITRAELSTMLRAYAVYAGLKVDLEPTFKYGRYADAGSIPAWAGNGVSWACSVGLIDQAGADGNLPTLAPNKTATRAEAAVMMMNLDLWVNPAGAPKLTINGNDISNYQIVYHVIEGKQSNNPNYEAAEVLAGYVERAYGVTLPIVADDEPGASQYEILIGHTNREGEGGVTVEREGLHESCYVIAVKGDKLVLSGMVDGKERRGAVYAAYDLCEEKFGYTFLNDNNVLLDPVDCDLPDGYAVNGGPVFRQRTVYWSTGWDDVFYNDGYYETAGMVHNMPDFTVRKGGKCCPSSQESVTKAIEYTRSLLKKKPNLQLIWLSQEDSRTAYCTCSECAQIIRDNNGARSAPVVRLCNTIYDAIKDDYPNVRLLTIAYQYTLKPPTVDLPGPGVMIYYAPIDDCMNHAYGDPECGLNPRDYEYFETWCDITDEVFVWDYCTNFQYGCVPLSNFEVIRRNALDFYEHGVTGVFNNSFTGQRGEFHELRAYLLTRLFREPNMSKEQYYSMLDGFLAGFYGAGWKNLRQYLDIMAEINDDLDFTCEEEPARMYSYDKIMKRMAEIDALWDAAEAYAASQTQLDRIRCSKISWTYLRQCALYNSMVALGSAETREAYYAANESLHNDMVRFKVKYSESKDLQYSREKIPSDW